MCQVGLRYSGRTDGTIQTFLFLETIGPGSCCLDRAQVVLVDGCSACAIHVGDLLYGHDEAIAEEFPIEREESEGGTAP